ncbi:MAG: PfkB family carbohydrate kinase, partial [Planctomycetota bacterium]
AAAADASGASAWFDGPFTEHPKLSTGAGDHFNGGFAFGRLVGLDLAQALALGSAVSGAYVRDAASPDRARVCAFLRSLPAPEA